MQKATIKSVDDFIAKVEREFVPADLQERLRDQMDDLRKRNNRHLPDYVGSFATWHRKYET